MERDTRQAKVPSKHSFLSNRFSKSYEPRKFCAKELVIDWKFMQTKEIYYTIKSNWVLEQMFNCKLVFWDSLG